MALLYGRIAAVALPLLLIVWNADAAEGQGALLFGYRLHQGEESQFYGGYGQHLEWHRLHEDSLVWYGWQVVTGDRLGLFVDGTFGQPFLAIDQRVDPAGDAADFAATAGPHADAIFRMAYTLRRALGTAIPLEQGRPTSFLEVISYEVRPGGETRFENVVRRATEMAAVGTDAPPFTWYQLVDGGRHSTYALMIHREGFAGWDSARADLASLIANVGDVPTRDSLASMMFEVVSDVRSELWRYLPGSSLIPESFQ